MFWKGNLRKMATEPELSTSNVVSYRWKGADILENKSPINPEGWIGQNIEINHTGRIHCVITGKRIKKAYGEGMCYDAWRSSPHSVESVIHPELSRIHEGIALRDKEWEEKHHNQPHIVYISQTSGLKVGVTRETNVPYRWHDQGAIGAIVICKTPYRQLAGQIEVALKPHMADRTNYRKMLAEVPFDADALDEAREQAFEWLGEEYESFFEEISQPVCIQYPVIEFPSKIQSVRLDKVPMLSGRLVGIKGQYLLFEDGRVLNIRNHAGYEIELTVGASVQ